MSRSILVIAALAALVAPRSGGAADYLVWLVEPGGATTTHWVRGSGDSFEDLANQPRVVVAGGEGMWAWHARPLVNRVCACDAPEDFVEDTSGCPEEQVGHAVEIVDLAGGARQEIVSGPSDGISGSRDQAPGLVGTVGPYLFVREDIHEYWCGAAHGGSSASFFVFDTRTGQAADLLTSAELAAANQRERARAWAAMRANDEDDMAPESPEELALTMLLPSYECGRLRLVMQFTGDACYACSDGLWSSYSQSGRAPSMTLPAILQPYAEMPPAVVQFIGKRTLDPDAPMNAGWSEVPAGRAEAWLASFRAATAVLGKAEQPREPAAASGTYRSEIGNLFLATRDDAVAWTYGAVFGAAHVCECWGEGRQDGVGYRLQDGAVSLTLRGDRAALSGAFDCCGAGWPGDELTRVGDLPTCTVTAERSHFHDGRDAGTKRKAYVIAGDQVQVVPASVDDADPFMFARFVGSKVTSGYVLRETLSCPEGWVP